MHKRLAFLVLILALACSQAAHALMLDFENGVQGARQQGAAAPEVGARDASQVDCTVSRSGRCALRIKVAVDPGYYSFGAYRVEWDFMKQPQLRYGAGETFTYSFSLMLPKDWVFEGSEYIDSVWQAKALGAGPDAFVTVKGRWLVLRGQDGLMKVLVPEMPTGVWVDVRLRIHWATDASGRIDYWAAPQGAQPVSGTVQGANVKTDKPKNGYIKFGLYKPGIPADRRWTERSVLLDDITIEKID